MSDPPTCGCLHRRVRVVESLQRRGLFPLQEALSVLRIQPQLLSFVEDRVQRLRAELPGRLLVLLGRGEAAGQRRHERGGERHALRQALRQAGAEAALQAGDLRVRVVAGGESLLQGRGRRRRRLEHHRPVRHEHRVAGVDKVSRAGLRGPPDQRVNAEGGGASEWPLHHHEGRTERCAHMNDRCSSEETGEEALWAAAEGRQTPSGAAAVTASVREPEFRGAIIRVNKTIPSVLRRKEGQEEKMKRKPRHVFFFLLVFPQKINHKASELRGVVPRSADAPCALWRASCEAPLQLDRTPIPQQRTLLLHSPAETECVCVECVGGVCFLLSAPPEMFWI